MSVGLRRFLAATLAALAAGLAGAGERPAAARVREFRDWPAGASPVEIGRRVAERFVKSPHLAPGAITYPETCAWYGALTFAERSGDLDLRRRLVARFEPLLTPAESALVPQERHVDFSVFGAVPLEVYLQTKDARALELGRGIAERQWEAPTPDGITAEARYWIDDMYMITALQVQAYRASAEPRYADRAALAMSSYLDRLQQPNGLFFHAPDVPFFWGRGNGWVAAGLAELLRSLPEEHPRRARLLAGYRAMMQALLRHQGPDGLWRQLIDRPEAWPETSSTAMFTFALVTGVERGLIEPGAAAPAARRAWLGLARHVNADGDVDEVCEGTGKKNDYQYYLDRKRNVGDLHGQAPLLWSATAFLR